MNDWFQLLNIFETVFDEESTTDTDRQPIHDALNVRVKPSENIWQLLTLLGDESEEGVGSLAL